MRNKVYIVTTVHPWNDNRIYYKQVLTAVRSGVDICYIAPGILCNDINKDVEYISIPETIKSRLGRSIHVLKNLFFLEKSVFHFHDPELIIIGAILKLRGWKIIYDMHEDYFLSFNQRQGSRLLNYATAAAVRVMERIFTPLFNIVIAEKVYAQSFPISIEVLNYPITTFLECTQDSLLDVSYSAIYTGTVSENRGALFFSRFLKCFPDYSLTVIGRCDRSLELKILESCSAYKDRLDLCVSKEGVDFGMIENMYNSKSWDFGLALFPDTPHYRDKLLTKFYEYMKYDIPTLASDFPAWRDFFISNECGVLVEVDNIDKSLSNIATKYLAEDLIKLKSNCQKSKLLYDWNSQYNNLRNLYDEIFDNN